MNEEFARVQSAEILPPDPLGRENEWYSQEQQKPSDQSPCSASLRKAGKRPSASKRSGGSGKALWNMKRNKAFILFIVLTLVVLVLDRVTKIIAIDQLSDRSPVVFLPAFLDFALVYNRGGAFGLFEGGGTLFVIVALVAVVCIIVYLSRVRELHLPIVIALSLITAGALGNAYDRAVSGAVPDFIHTLFIEFPVFNIADIALTVGEFTLLVTVAYFWFGPRSREATADDE